MQYIDKEIMGYFETLEVVDRILLQKKNKLAKVKSFETKKFYEGQILLYESIKHYVELCLKRHSKTQ
jgi:hypothetical protein